MYLDHQRMLQLQSQRNAQLHTQQLARQREHARMQSIEHCRPPQQQTEWQRQLTARKVIPNGPMPADAWSQLVGGKGTWMTQGHLAHKYGSEQLETWRWIWLTTTLVGKQELSKLIERREKHQRSVEALKERDRQKVADRAERRLLQERFWLESGSLCRIAQPRSEIDGRVGTVLRMDWINDVLFATVLIDQLPADSPWRSVEMRNRPARFAPVSYRLKAECLSPASHPAD